MKTLILIMGLAGLFVQQPDPQPAPDTHNPVACARVAGFNDDGPIHACTCKHMGHQDGEECVRTESDRSCKAYCRYDLCQCPVACEHPAAGDPR